MRRIGPLRTALLAVLAASACGGGNQPRNATPPGPAPLVEERAPEASGDQAGIAAGDRSGVAEKEVSETGLPDCDAVMRRWRCVYATTEEPEKRYASMLRLYRNTIARDHEWAIEKCRREMRDDHQFEELGC